MKRNQMRTKWATMAFLLTATLMNGCGGGGKSSPTTPVTVSVSREPLTEAEITSVSPSTLEELAKAFDAVAAEDPELDRNSNEFARMLLGRLANTGRTGVARRSYDLDGPLNAAEWLLIFTHPLGRIYAAATWTAKISAETLAAQAFPGSGWQTKQDAFRHASWNIFMAKRCDLDWAEAFATAHEWSSPEGDDKTMDLNNNAVGRRLYQDHASASDSEFAVMVRNHEYVHEQCGVQMDAAGRLVYIRPFDIASIEVQPAAPTLVSGTSITLTASALDAAGHKINVPADKWEWTAPVSGSAVVSLKGRAEAIEFAAGEAIEVTGVHEGTSQITVLQRDTGKQQSVTVTVTAANSEPAQPKVSFTDAGLDSLSGGRLVLRFRPDADILDKKADTWVEIGGVRVPVDLTLVNGVRYTAIYVLPAWLAPGYAGPIIAHHGPYRSAPLMLYGWRGDCTYRWEHDQPSTLHVDGSIDLRLRAVQSPNTGEFSVLVDPTSSAEAQAGGSCAAQYWYPLDRGAWVTETWEGKAKAAVTGSYHRSSASLSLDMTFKSLITRTHITTSGDSKPAGTASWRTQPVVDISVAGNDVMSGSSIGETGNFGMMVNGNHRLSWGTLSNAW